LLFIGRKEEIYNDNSIITKITYIYRVPKKYIHISRDVIYVLLFEDEAVVRRNQKCLDADGNHYEHLL